MFRAITTPAPVHALVAALVMMCAVVCTSRDAKAVLTPYHQEPAAVCTNVYGSGQLWDAQFASNLGSYGRQFYIFDFCHSGGFVGDVSGAGRYVAAACQWDEYGFGTSFNQPFWQAIGAGSMVTQAFNSGFAAAHLLQTPTYSDPGGLATQTLAYQSGDLAFIYSSDAAPDLGTDELTNVNNALSGAGWPSSAITSFHGALSPDKFETIYAATKDPANANRKIVVYLGDHGASTDVIKSRVSGTRYEYEFVGSIGRIDTDPGGRDYGIAKLVTEIALAPFPEWPLTENEYYSGVTAPKQTWRWTSSGGEVTWYSAYPDDPQTWLDPGMPYDFGFNSFSPYVKVGWESYVYDAGEANPASRWSMDDWGIPRDDGLDYGDGSNVWMMNLSPHRDPYQWPGWANGADGWILAPIPEPSATCLLLLLMLRRRAGAW